MNKQKVVCVERETLALSTSVLGAAHEMLVCSDLMKAGYHVFRAQSPTCPTDIVALTNGLILRIDVKTGWVTPTGVIGRSTSRVFENGNDIAAIVLHNGSIFYFDQEGNDVTTKVLRKEF